MYQLVGGLAGRLTGRNRKSGRILASMLLGGLQVLEALALTLYQAPPRLRVVKPGSRAFQYGGQAVIEGVMMRGPASFAIALRGPDGGIITHREDFVSWGRRWRFLGKPFVRGPVALAETLYVGVKALLFSANEILEGEDKKLTTRDVFWMILIAVAFVVGVFVLLPTFLANFAWGPRGLAGPAGLAGPGGLTGSAVAFNLLEGLIRIGLILAYMWAISRIRDIQRVLEYHGAEHKAINALESAAGLDLDSARRNSRFHPRCGTSFLLFVGLMSVALFSLFGWPGIWQRVFYRLLLLPVVASLSYEMIKLAGSGTRWPISQFMAAPGIWLQRLTTREPDDGQIEVAINALTGVLEG